MFEIHPLFPSVIASNVITENMVKLHSIKELNFTKTNEGGSLISNSFSILDNFPEEKQIILKYFNYYKNNILMLHDTEFCITTSWATKCLEGDSSDIHNHKNCIFSAVLYLDNVVSGGVLEFFDLGLKPGSIKLNDPSELNYYNSDLFYIHPEKNKLVIFPSYLYHRVSTHTDKTPRYSIALNFMPIGATGKEDSRCTYANNI